MKARIIDILSPENWSRYSRRFLGNKEGLRQHKRVILLSQFTLAATFAGILYAIKDLIEGMLFMALMDSVVIAAVFVCYLLNENGRHRFARIGLLWFLNIFFFIYSSLAHHQLGIYLYYFSWVGLAAVVFERDENGYRFFFIALSIALAVILFATDFMTFGSVKFDVVYMERSFITNFIVSIAALVFFIVFMVNINESSERELLELAREVRSKNTDLEKVNRELDRFFYSASHDLKVPLLDIKGAIQRALIEIKDQEVREYFILMQERASKLDSFLQDIIDYSRNAQTELMLESINMSQFVVDVIDNFTFIKDTDEIHFKIDIHFDSAIETDRLRLQTVMNNLLSNAIKYHALDGRYPWISIEADYAEGMLHLSVADNGQGIEEDLLPKIFNMFFRGTNQSKGSGLGLYIVKETVEKMGGHIRVESTRDVGSTFSLTLPARLLKPATTPSGKNA